MIVGEQTYLTYRKYERIIRNLVKSCRRKQLKMILLSKCIENLLYSVYKTTDCLNVTSNTLLFSYRWFIGYNIVIKKTISPQWYNTRWYTHHLANRKTELVIISSLIIDARTDVPIWQTIILYEVSKADHNIFSHDFIGTGLTCTLIDM